MDLVFSRLDDTVARYTLTSVSPSFINAIRRAMCSEVPKLAIEDIKIYDNTSALFDEMLAHRIGLVPLKTNSDVYVSADRCTCEGAGCDRCSTMYTLSVEGPGMVYSRDLIPSDPEAVPVDEKIPIVKLEMGQKVVIEARAEMNLGKVHAKWQPTINCGYKNYPVITIETHCDACGTCVDQCPRQVLVLKGGVLTVEEGKLESCSLCRLCEKACLSTGIGDESGIRISDDATRFIGVVESDGSLPVRTIIRQSLLYLKNESNELAEKLQEISEG